MEGQRVETHTHTSELEATEGTAISLGLIMEAREFSAI